MNKDISPKIPAEKILICESFEIKKLKTDMFILEEAWYRTW